MEVASLSKGPSIDGRGMDDVCIAACFDCDHSVHLMSDRKDIREGRGHDIRYEMNEGIKSNDCTMESIML